MKTIIVTTAFAALGVASSASSPPKGICYIGCYRDDGWHRDLRKLMPGKFNVDLCRAACSSYKYFAVQNGAECRCANWYESDRYRHIRLDDSECTKEGYPAGHGGSLANSIYKTKCNDACTPFNGILHPDNLGCCGASCGKYCGDPHVCYKGDGGCCAGTILKKANCSSDQDAPCPLRTPKPVNCVGHWTKCPRDCRDRVFVITTPASEGGWSCETKAGAKMKCYHGDDFCRGNGLTDSELKALSKDHFLKKSVAHTLDMASLSAKIYDSKVKAGDTVTASTTDLPWKVKSVMTDAKGYGKIWFAEFDIKCALVVRGTHDAKTALTNNMNWGTDTVPGTSYKVMKGYQAHIMAILMHKDNFNKMKSWLQSCHNRGYEKIFTGHSLGGAVATWLSIFYESQKESLRPTYVVTFGSPRLVMTFGSDKCPRSLQTREKAVRIVTMNEKFCDAAALIPPSTNTKEAFCFESFSLDGAGNLLEKNDQWPNWSFNYVLNVPGWELHSSNNKYEAWLKLARKKVETNAKCYGEGTHCDNIGDYWGKGSCKRVCCYGAEYKEYRFRHECKAKAKPCLKNGKWCSTRKEPRCGRCCSRRHMWIGWTFVTGFFGHVCY